MAAEDAPYSSNSRQRGQALGRRESLSRESKTMASASINFIYHHEGEKDPSGFSVLGASMRPNLTFAHSKFDVGNKASQFHSKEYSPVLEISQDQVVEEETDVERGDSMIEDDDGSVDVDTSQAAAESGRDTHRFPMSEGNEVSESIGESENRKLECRHLDRHRHCLFKEFDSVSHRRRHEASLRLHYDSQGSTIPFLDSECPACQDPTVLNAIKPCKSISKQVPSLAKVGYPCRHSVCKHPFLHLTEEARDKHERDTQQHEYSCDQECTVCDAREKSKPYRPVATQHTPTAETRMNKEEWLMACQSILEEANSKIQQLGRPTCTPLFGPTLGVDVDMGTIVCGIVKLVQCVGEVSGSNHFMHNVAIQLDHTLKTSHQTQFTQPDMIDNLVSMCVHDRLSDDEFRQHIRLFVVDEQLSKQVYNKCKQRKEEHLKQFDLQACNERRGAFVNLEKYIEFVFKSAKYEPKTGPYHLKFEMDATCVSKTQRNMNAVAFEIIAPSNTTAECMCPRNAHVFLLYRFEDANDEKNAGLARILQPVVADINRLVQQKSMKMSDGREIIFETVILGADLKALCALLGLYAIFSPNSEFLCPYCEITRKDVNNVDVMFSCRGRTLKSLLTQAGTRREINGKPILCIEPCNFIFDLLHTEENITRSVAFGW